MDLVVTTIEPELFSELDQAFQSGGAPAAFTTLIERLGAGRHYSHRFEARLMQKRHQLGLALTSNGPGSEIPEKHRASWDATVTAAAREAGEAYLREGEIARAWPYFRALGDQQPVKDAIEKLPIENAADEVIDVALYQGVHPERGYAMVLATHGSCRAITTFDQYPYPESREAALDILTRALHEELSANLARAIEKQEGSVVAAAGPSIAEMIAGRDWLFGEYDYYIDTSHLLSALRFAVESNSPAVWRRALDFAEYGRKLAPMFHYAGDPPFEKPYLDHAMFLRGLLGIDVDASIAHFKEIARTVDPERIGTYPAQVLVRYLIRLGRPQEAIEVFEQYLTEADPQYLTCPNLTQLCQLAGDHDRLRRVARDREDVLSYVAGHLLKAES